MLQFSVISVVQNEILGKYLKIFGSPEQNRKSTVLLWLHETGLFRYFAGRHMFRLSNFDPAALRSSYGANMSMTGADAPTPSLSLLDSEKKGSSMTGANTPTSSLSLLGSKKKGSSMTGANTPTSSLLGSISNSLLDVTADGPTRSLLERFCPSVETDIWLVIDTNCFLINKHVDKLTDPKIYSCDIKGTILQHEELEVLKEFPVPAEKSRTLFAVFGRQQIKNENENGCSFKFLCLSPDMKPMSVFWLHKAIKSNTTLYWQLFSSKITSVVETCGFERFLSPVFLMVDSPSGATSVNKRHGMLFQGKNGVPVPPPVYVLVRLSVCQLRYVERFVIFRVQCVLYISIDFCLGCLTHKEGTWDVYWPNEVW